MSQTGAGKTKIVFDAADAANSDQIGANLIANGTQLTATGTSLDVNVTASSLPTGAATETTLASILSELQLIDNVDGLAWSAGSTGIETLAVRKDASGPLTGVADGDFSPLQVNALGELKVAAAISIGDNHAEDAAASSGDIGSFSLGVRNDDMATVVTSANGDYSQFSVDDTGAQYVKDIAAKSNLQQIITVGTSAVALPTSPLANRSSMMIQMLSGGQLFLGSSTVTNSGATRGFMIGNGGFVSLDVGPANLIYGVANAAGKDVMVWEFA
jgi:hypothetical protein